MESRGILQWVVRGILGLCVLGPFVAAVFGGGLFYLVSIWAPGWAATLACLPGAAVGYGIGIYLALNRGASGSAPEDLSLTRLCKPCGNINHSLAQFCAACARPLVTLGDRRREIRQAAAELPASQGTTRT